MKLHFALCAVLTTTRSAYAAHDGGLSPRRLITNMAVSPSRFMAALLPGIYLILVFSVLYTYLQSRRYLLTNEGIIGATIDEKNIIIGNMNTTLLRQPSTKQHVMAAKEPIIPSITTVTSADDRSRTFTKTSWAECAWWNNSTEWGDQEEFSGLLDKARDEAHVTFQGRSVLVLGGSTSRDLASHFLRMVLAPQLRNEVTKKWRNSSIGHYETIFPVGGKKMDNFKDMYTPGLMHPLMDAGWEFERISGPAAGCSDCKAAFTNIDYVASLRGGAAFDNNNSDDAGISYEFSWKPEIFTQSDFTGFRTRYCSKKYDVVHIGKGLHDAAFQNLKQLTPSKLRERFLKLAELIQCFPETTLVILRTPNLSTVTSTVNAGIEENVNINTTEILKELVGEGAFGASRSILIDGHLLTTKPGHPAPFDGHHYKSSVSKAYLNLLAYATQQFFKKPSNNRLGGSIFREQAGRWKHCGLGVSTNDAREGEAQGEGYVSLR